LGLARTAGSAACSCRRWAGRPAPRRDELQLRRGAVRAGLGRRAWRGAVGGAFERCWPCPPLAAGGHADALAGGGQSLSSSPRSASWMIVPGGTRMVRSLPRRPWQFFPWPCRRLARQWCRPARCWRVVYESSAETLRHPRRRAGGPAAGTNFSRPAPVARPGASADLHLIHEGGAPCRPGRDGPARCHAKKEDAPTGAILACSRWFARGRGRSRGPPGRTQTTSRTARGTTPSLPEGEEGVIPARPTFRRPSAACRTGGR